MAWPAAQISISNLKNGCPQAPVSETWECILSELSLAYIGTDSSTTRRDEHDFRSSRFRLGDKKEGAGAAFAVISLRSMGIE